MPRSLRALQHSLLLSALLGGSLSAQRPVQALIDSLRALPRDMTADQQRWHLLNRLAFGARPGDADRLRATGVDAWIDAQLTPDAIADDSCARFIARFPSLSKSGSELLALFPPPGAALLAAARAQGDSAARNRAGLANARQEMTPEQRQQARQGVRQAYQFVGELQSARVARAVASERQLQEVVTDFWLNHFSVFAGKDRIRYYLPEYEASIRTHALGSFRELLGVVAKSPAMLLYLDNAQSVADSTQPTLRRRVSDAQARRMLERAPRMRQLPDSQRSQMSEQLLARRARGLNENYARELLELHTLGVDGGYTQQDVIEVARVLTGWTVDRNPTGNGQFQFRAQTHDAGAKRVLGTVFPAGRGQEEGEAVLDLLARHPSTARFIATKLTRRLVSDSPPAALVQRAARVFTETRGDIRAVVRVIAASPEFWASSAWRAKVKSPFEVVVSTMRGLGAQPDSSPRSAQMMARLGQPLYGHQAPNGWPETGDAWMNTGAILNRINFGMAVASDRRGPLATWPVASTLATASREQQVDGVVQSLLGGAISAETRQVLMSGAHPMMAAALAADTVVPSEDAAMTMTRPVRARGERRPPNMSQAQRAAAREAVKPERGGAITQLFGAPASANGFAQVVGLALGSPEFQRR
jgi:uncharacterized protein (DUF1800 family)